MMNRKLKDLLIFSSHNIFIQLLRYTFVGGFAFIIDFALLYILTEYAQLHYLSSATIAFITGLVINYFLSTIWVFGASPYKKKVEFLLFALVGIVGLGLNDLFMWLFTEKCQIYYMLSKLIAAICVCLWNFLVRRFFIFNKEK